MITITWNGENAIMLTPSLKVWAAVLSIFATGIVCIGGAALALIAGTGYLLWVLAALLLHALTVAIYSSIFSFVASLFLCAGLLVLFIFLSLHIFGLPPCKGVQA